MIKTPLSTVIGGAFWTPGATILGSSSKTLTQLIKSIFTTGEQGFAYDPNDLTTLYQDAAGTIPVTAQGQPVGLMLDKSGRNNHAYQSVSASRPILQQTPILGNELVVNGNFSNGLTGWSSPSGYASTAQVIDGAIEVTPTQDFGRYTQNLNLTAGKTYKISGNVAAKTGSQVYVALGYGTTADSNVVGASTQTNSLTGFESLFVPTTGAVNVSLSCRYTGTVGVFDNISVREVTGYRTDQNYLKFDGVDDSLQTNNIDFTATDKVSLFAGVRKLSDAASYSVVYELSNDAEIKGGAFMMMTPYLASNKSIYFTSMGTELNYAHISNFPAPINLLTTMQASIGTPLLKARVNGVQVSNSLASQGTGNYGNYPLYIGRRAGTTLPFNGHLYSLIGIGRLTTDSETITLERAIAKNTGVALSV